MNQANISLVVLLLCNVIICNLINNQTSTNLFFCNEIAFVDTLEVVLKQQSTKTEKEKMCDYNHYNCLLSVRSRACIQRTDLPGLKISKRLIHGTFESQFVLTGTETRFKIQKKDTRAKCILNRQEWKDSEKIK